ncbi:hypothetical protein GCM10025881_01760 [Pseudolysinimonas kribbensis]|uniref:Uncharacterized protein n=1 Tax=Pseudolysinimonas kribbensis TaxID=433641 RepID=A0ABQ6K085_9MICO|nr:hypothetical protein GCM10025881_01760 [Pseudolysinimonas kribbensis]
MRRHARLVVRGPATREPVAAERGLVRLRLPVGIVTGRLHVVMGVEQNRRPAVARRPGGEHGGEAVLLLARDRRADDLDRLEHAGGAGQLRHGVGTALHLFGVESVPGDGGNAHETREVGDGGRESGLHRLAQLGRSGVVSVMRVS